MMRTVGASVLFATLVSTAACGVGNDPGGTNGGSDDRTKLGVQCSASFKVTGTFVQAATPARPIDPDTGAPITGCWPVGTWTFSATVDQNACPNAPTVLPSYSFKVDRVDDGNGFQETITSMTTTGNLRYHLAMSSNGQGCEGHFELGSPDGKDYWNFQPTLLKTATTQLSGAGDYDRYNNDGWPWQ